MARFNREYPVHLLRNREYNEHSAVSFQRRMQVSQSLINRLGLETELEVIII